MILNSRVVAFARQREITGEPLNSRSRILAPNRREITGVDCTYKHIMCSLLSSIHENNCFLFFKRYHMNIYPSATQKLPPTLWTISRASIARMSKSPRRGHIACEFWKIEDVAFIFSVYFMALWTFAYDHGYRNCDRAGSASTRWVGAVVQGPCGRRSWGEIFSKIAIRAIWISKSIPSCWRYHSLPLRA